MRFIYFWLVFILAGTAYSQNYSIDTVKGRILFQNNNTTIFEIPVNSIQLQKKEGVRVKEKFGAYTFKRKQLLNYEFQIKTLNDTSLKLIQTNPTIENSSITLKFIKGYLRFQSNQESRFIKFDLKLNENETFYGGGIQFSNLNLSKHHYSNVSEENGIGRGDTPISKWTKLGGVAGHLHSTYFPSNSFVSSNGRSININSLSDTYIYFDTSVVSISIDIKNSVIDVKRNNTIKLASRRFRHHVFSLSPPNWSLKPILGLQGGTKSVLDKIKTIEDSGTEISAVWIQDWVGKKDTKFGQRLNWQWQLDTNNYTNFNDFKNSLKKKNIKLLGYINPFFAESGFYIDQGLDSNYFIQNDNGVAKLFDYGGMGGYMLDIFNKDAYRWMSGIIRKELLGNGFEGWMADFAEWLPINNQKDIELHNRYVQEWQNMQHEQALHYGKRTGKELFIFHRSGNQGNSPRAHSIWAGDQMVNYGLNDGLPSVIRAMQNCGLSGLGLLHSDIGGYTSVKRPIIKNQLRTKALLDDWTKMEAFTPIFRTHEGLLPQDDIQVYSDTEAADHFAFWAKVHTTLIPYFEILIDKYHTTGKPLFYPYLALEDQPKLDAESDYIVFVGDAIFIAFDESFPAPPNWSEFIDEKGDLINRIRIFLKNNSEPFKLLNQ